MVTARGKILTKVFELRERKRKTFVAENDKANEYSFVISSAALNGGLQDDNRVTTL